MNWLIVKNKEYESILGWNSADSFFFIKDRKNFEEIFLPNVFSHKSFATFTRQVSTFFVLFFCWLNLI